LIAIDFHFSRFIYFYACTSKFIELLAIFFLGREWGEGKCGSRDEYVEFRFDLFEAGRRDEYIVFDDASSLRARRAWQSIICYILDCFVISFLAMTDRILLIHLSIVHIPGIAHFGKINCCLI
jgi:hypothetical protein